MTTIHQLVSWIKVKSKRPQQIKMAEAPVEPMTQISEQEELCDATAVLIDRGTICRASMKLPPIPREERRQQIALSRTFATNSPAHIYEEIPYAALHRLNNEEHKCSDSAAIPKDMYNKDTVDITKLDFEQAQEFGSYLVVPIKGKLLQGQGQGHSTLDVTSHTECGDTSAICDTSVTSYGSQTSRGEWYSGGDVSSSDSGFHSANGDHRRLIMGHNHGSIHSEQHRMSVASHDSGHGDEITTPLDTHNNHHSNHGQMEYHSNHESMNQHSNHSQMSHQLSHHDNHETTDHHSNHRQGDHHINHGHTDESGGRHVHCRKCSRPHGIYHGMLMTGDHNSENDKVQFDVYTLENLNIQDDNSNGTTSAPHEQRIPQHRLGQLGSAFTACVPRSNTAALPRRNGIITCFRGRASHDNFKQSCDKVSPRSISESDSGASSVYAYSGSDKELIFLQDFVRSREKLHHHESDSSNDTFSEYDIRSGEVTPSSTNDEYDYLLSKVRHNFALKQDVQNIIKSESSEYETSEYQDETDIPDDRSDTNSFTTVTSLSDMSTIDLDDGKSEKSDASKTDHSDTKVKRKCKKENRSASSDGNLSNHADSDKGKKTKDSDKQVRGSKTMKSAHARTENRKAMKKKLNQSNKATECYTLPDFPRSALDLTNKEAADFDALDRLSCRATVYIPCSEVSTEEPVTDMKDSDRLSCRATDYKPHSDCKGKPTGTGNKPPQTLPVNKQPGRQRQDHNRLLSDLMKMNHDRQLLVLF